tara:strand:- start:44 stop:577 length:534 start_codon:yes stop_codon:yes gene_type:complete
MGEKYGNVSKNVLSIVQNECYNVIRRIAYHLGHDENVLLNRFMPQSITINDLVVKKRNRRTLPKEEMCMGRKLDYKQCTRRRLAGQIYCKSHLRNRPMGRIDEKVPIDKCKGKRGRKRKNIVQDFQNNEEYIAVWEEIIQGEKYYVDQFNHVYTNNATSPSYLGKKTMEGTIQKVGA